MNPVNIEKYTSGLFSTFNEKMFFYTKIDLNNTIFIDFGCGEGSILNYIYARLLNGDIQNTLLIGVEQNEALRFLTESKLGAKYITSRVDSTIHKAYEIYTNLESVKEFLSTNPELIKGRKVVMLCSSVLHELNSYQNTLFKFVKDFVDVFIVRDMYVKVDQAFTYKHIAKIIKNSNPKMLSEFIEKYGMSSEQILHYLLKYTYVENWASEIKEDYTSVKWDKIEKLGYPIFDTPYLQEWRRNKVKEDFGFNLDVNGCLSHRSLIIKVFDKSKN